VHEANKDASHGKQSNYIVHLHYKSKFPYFLATGHKYLLHPSNHSTSIPHALFPKQLE
jgi:hypothetical protein